MADLDRTGGAIFDPMWPATSHGGGQACACYDRQRPMLTPDEQAFLEVYRAGDLARLRRWCRDHPAFPFRGVHNHELSDTYYRLVCDAIAKTLRHSM
jgi:hypothetical protein